MKNGKNPTLAQRKILENNRLNSDNWYIIKDTPTQLVIISKENAKKNVRKEKVINK